MNYVPVSQRIAAKSHFDILEFTGSVVDEGDVHTFSFVYNINARACDPCQGKVYAASFIVFYLHAKEAENRCSVRLLWFI
jgi:hypothetical protein